MKITKEQLKQIIKEELESSLSEQGDRKGSLSQLSGIGFEIDDLINKAIRLIIDTEMGGDRKPIAIDIADHIRDDVKERYRKLVWYVQSAAKEGSSAKEKELDEADSGKKSPDDIIARYPDPEGKNPDQVIYRWQQDEFDQHQAAWKDFMKRKKK